MINYRSIDTEWDNEFGSCEGIIDSRQNKSRHFMAEINRVPYLIKKKISQKEEFLANTIIYGHVKLQLPVLESEHDAAELEKFFHEFKKTRQFGEMSCDYNKKNYNIYLFSEGKLHHEHLPSAVHIRFGEAYYVKWYIKGKLVKILEEDPHLSSLKGYSVKRKWVIGDDGFISGEEARKDFEEIDKKLINGDLYDEFKTSGMVHSSFL